MYLVYLHPSVGFKRIDISRKQCILDLSAVAPSINLFAKMTSTMYRYREVFLYVLSSLRPLASYAAVEANSFR